MKKKKFFPFLKPNFNKAPYIEVKNQEGEYCEGWASIFGRIQHFLSEKGRTSVTVIESYQGVNHEEILQAVRQYLCPDLLIDTTEAFLPEKEILELTWPDVTDDRVFGYMTRLEMADFMDRNKRDRLTEKVRSGNGSNIVVYGYGASLIAPNPDILIYADMARWEIQGRMRRNEVCNLGLTNKSEAFELQYKRGFFVDWRVCDRLKKRSFRKWDFVLDTSIPARPKMITASAFRTGLTAAV